MSITISLRIALFSFLLFPWIVNAQSSISVRNNTWQSLEVKVEQTGSHTLDPGEWDQKRMQVEAWESNIELMETDRDASAVPLGDSIFFDVQLIAATDTLHLLFKIDGISGGSELDYSFAGPGVADPWFDNGGFHQVNSTLAGQNITVKYAPENGDGNQSRDLLFAIHERPLYQIDSLDFQDPNVLNVMAYNLQMLPFGISGMGQANDRADYFPAELSPWQDVVIFEEVFDGSARESHLAPEMVAEGFPYRTDVLNDYLPFNGGVVIFSRWPIETVDMYDFALCGPNSGDCFANKGILYAEINKLGKRYHVLGTHMDAGSSPDDLEAKNLQMAEMRDFIAQQNIPDHEAVVYGGDFNVGPTDGHNLYANMHDSLDPIIPRHIGYYESTFGADTADIIDHIWACGKHLIPLEATNEIITPRPLQDDLWELGEFSDHRAVLGRFSYPDIQVSNADTSLCPGDNFTLSVTASNMVSYQWIKDGLPISGANSATLTLSNVQVADAGVYACEVQYTQIFGSDSHFLTPYFFPNGPDTVLADLEIELGELDVNCTSGGILEEMNVPSFTAFPNPVSSALTLQWEHITAQVNWELFSPLGQKIQSGTLFSSPSILSLKELEAGVYFLKLTDVKGSFYLRVLKQ